ncbi:hypothetical protein N0V83_010704 [Neocucurbitaria cava]|uniref:Ecp2 effector protein-like domain-containing protein n=1 Tax=Neocucurbitaria cava TaxID=798079 RepID=A0A9W8XZW5_9PLEO|nr:hypothetical protein N0V83_010704 [Neocucurbitaria cava]
MQFSTSLLVASLLALAYTAPTSSNPQGVAVERLTARNSVNDCGDSTFENQSSGGSPKVSDCQQITRNIAGGGTWRTLVTYGTCALGVQSFDSASGTWYNVGNQDIIDVINTSIQKFTFNGLVGAKGNMHCQGDRNGLSVDWAIYHT